MMMMIIVIVVKGTRFGAMGTRWIAAGVGGGGQLRSLELQNCCVTQNIFVVVVDKTIVEYMFLFIDFGFVCD
jgi:hypothetical protein